MKRVENCVNAKINRILFHGDCLVFKFAKYKGHQRGEKFSSLACLCKSIKNVFVSSAIIIVVFFIYILMYRMVMCHFSRGNHSTHNMLRD